LICWESQLIVGKPIGIERDIGIACPHCKEETNTVIDNSTNKIDTIK
jgi:hypothetical protein